eukprot:PhM_4_TR16413/c0_g1_i2/m.48542/K03801/lipB; lipoyl(octanoyl) transferase
MKRPLQIVNWGQIAYAPALARQFELQSQRKQNLIPDTIALCEHNPGVYTIGNRDTAHHLLSVPNDVEVHKLRRGGGATYHGPGQLMAYFFLRLDELHALSDAKVTHCNPSPLRWFVCNIEKSVVTFLKRYDVAGVAENTGVWVGSTDEADSCSSRKIASIGLQVSRWVTMHGMCLNIGKECPAYFDNIVMCELEGRKACSLEQILEERGTGVATVGSIQKGELTDVIGRQFIEDFVATSQIPFDVKWN